MMRYAAIDIGTNTALLLIADMSPDGTIHPLYHGHEIIRLGKGVDQSGIIHPDSLTRLETTLGEFARVSREHKVDAITAGGTSALRDATNSKEVIAHIKKSSGIDLRVLSGEEEAELTYLGAVSEFTGKHDDRFAVLDIGGGSTEITLGKGLTPDLMLSVDVGCVRLTERFFRNLPPGPSDLERARSTVNDHLSTVQPGGGIDRLIGVAGTLTTLGSMDMNMERYDPLRVSGYRLSFGRIRLHYNRLRNMTLDEIKRVPQILPGRADILLAGVVILLEVMNRMEINEITVSDRGLRYGLAMRLARRGKKP